MSGTQLTGLNVILRRKQAEAASGYSRSTIYLRISQGLWTKPISLGARAVGWPAREVEVLNAARIAGKSDAELRQLVARLEASRADALPSEAATEVHHVGGPVKQHVVEAVFKTPKTDEGSA